MPRRYVVEFENTTVTAASDLITIIGAANKMLEIVSWGWSNSDNTLTTAQMLYTRCRLLPATVTNGSGGSTPTPQKTDPGDAAATFTAHANDTVKSSTSGTAIVEDVASRHIYNGYEQTPEKPIPVRPDSSFVFELASASVQGAPKLNAFVVVDEIG